MRYITLFLAVTFVVALALITGPTAGAQSPHIVGDVTFTDNGTSLTASGKVAGLGNEDVVIIVGAVADATVDCRNRGGHVVHSHQQQHAVIADAVFPSPQNGTVSFSLTTDPITAEAIGAVCPNRNWTPEVRDVAFSTVTLFVFQGDVAVIAEEFAV